MDKKEILSDSVNQQQPNLQPVNEQYPNFELGIGKDDNFRESVNLNVDPVRDEIVAAEKERRISHMQNKRPELPVEQDIRRSTFNKFQIQEIQKLQEHHRLLEQQQEQQSHRAIIPSQPIQMNIKQKAKISTKPNNQTKPKVEAKPQDDPLKRKGQVNAKNETKPKVEPKPAPPVRQSVTQKYAAELNQAVFHRIPMHFRSMAANLIWIFAFIIFIPEYAAGILDLSGVGLFFVLLSFYVTYLAVGLACNTLLQYLSPDNVHHGQKMEAEYEKVKKLDGHFTFFAECYHYETRVRTRVVYINGTLVTQTYTTTEKVVTHKATQTFRPSHTFDDSGRLAPVMAAKQVVFINNRVHYKFKDKASRENYNVAWQNFKSRHKRDTHQTYIDDYVIPGLKERMTFYVGTKPESMRNIFFIGTILGLLWFVSMFIESKVCRYHVDYTKILTIAGKTVNTATGQTTNNSAKVK